MGETEQGPLNHALNLLKLTNTRAPLGCLFHSLGKISQLRLFADFRLPAQPFQVEYPGRKSLSGLHASHLGHRQTPAVQPNSQKLFLSRGSSMKNLEFDVVCGLCADRGTLLSEEKLRDTEM